MFPNMFNFSTRVHIGVILIYTWDFLGHPVCISMENAQGDSQGGTLPKNIWGHWFESLTQNPKLSYLEF